MSKSSSDYGFISLLYSIGDRPLALWSKHVSTDGRVRRVEDDALNGDRVIEIRDGSTATRTCISCPASPEDFLDIRLPVLVVVLKNLKAPVRIAFQLIDEENIRRKFVLSTCDTAKSMTKHDEPETVVRLPLKLDDGWNLLEIDLRSLCRTTRSTEYRALQRLIIYPNCRVRRVYLQDRHYEHNETPVELCQAFFDMYMLKWGIHFVEKSCQTAAEENGTTIHAENSPPVFEGKKQAKLISKEKLRKGVRRSAGRGLTKKGEKSSGNENRKKIAKAETLKLQKGDEVNVASSPQKVIDGTNSSALRIIDSSNIDAKGPIVVSSLGNYFPERKWPSLSDSSTATSVAAIPSVVEVEATEATRNVESTKSKLLTTDEAVGRFLELRHAINRKMLENFRARGLTMTEVELSIYNSKNRRNSYGQGKLVEKHRSKVDKACDAFPSVDEAIENETNLSAMR